MPPSNLMYDYWTLSRRRDTHISFCYFVFLMTVEVCSVGFYFHSSLLSLCSQVCGFFSNSLIIFKAKIASLLSLWILWKYTHIPLLKHLILLKWSFIIPLAYHLPVNYQWKEWTRWKNQDSKNMTSWKVLGIFDTFCYCNLQKGYTF